MPAASVWPLQLQLGTQVQQSLCLSCTAAQGQQVLTLSRLSTLRRLRIWMSPWQGHACCSLPTPQLPPGAANAVCAGSAGILQGVVPDPGYPRGVRADHAQQAGDLAAAGRLILRLACAGAVPSLDIVSQRLPPDLSQVHQTLQNLSAHGLLERCTPELQSLSNADIKTRSQCPATACVPSVTNVAAGVQLLGAMLPMSEGGQGSIQSWLQVRLCTLVAV